MNKDLRALLKESAVVLSVIGVISLAACGSAAPKPPPVNTGDAGYVVEHVKFDGRDITCIRYGQVGISCDWEAK